MRKKTKTGNQMNSALKRKQTNTAFNSQLQQWAGEIHYTNIQNSRHTSFFTNLKKHFQTRTVKT